MTDPLRINVPDDLRSLIVQAAAELGQTPEEWSIAALRGRLTRRDLALRKHFGAVDLGTPTGVDNAQIDLDLAQSYADSHEDR